MKLSAPPLQPASLLLGVVLELDLAEARARVQIGDLETDFIPWQAARAGSIRVWAPPSLGEQVVVLTPDRSLEGALILGGIFSDASPQNGADETALITFGDGASVSYDPMAHTMAVSLPAGGTVTIQADGGVTITGPVSITGDLDVTGTVTASGDVIASGKSLKSHKHLAVQSGTSQSGGPV